MQKLLKGIFIRIYRNLKQREKSIWMECKHLITLDIQCKINTNMKEMLCLRFQCVCYCFSLVLVFFIEGSSFSIGIALQRGPVDGVIKYRCTTTPGFHPTL